MTNLPIESNDDAVLKMLSGAKFGPGANIILPSGRKISGDEAQAFSSAFSPDSDDPLSSANDNWTGDHETDRAIFVDRALKASEYRKRKSDGTTKPSLWRRLMSKKN